MQELEQNQTATLGRKRGVGVSTSLHIFHSSTMNFRGSYE